MRFPTFRTIALGVLAGTSTVRDGSAQEPLNELVVPPGQRRSSQVQGPLQPTVPYLMPTDVASGPIAHYGPDYLKARVTACANESLAEMARAWCDIPIEIPIAPMHVTVLKEGASGQATMNFQDRRMSAVNIVVNADEFRMPEVIRHEMTHLVLRARCGLGLPRWFDEGCASWEEGPRTVEKFRRDLVTNYLVNDRGISFQSLFTTVENPKGDLTMPFYAEATTLVQFLLERAPGESLENKRRYLIQLILRVMEDGASIDSYHRHIREYFGFERASSLQSAWLEWLQRGSDRKPR